MGRDTSNCIYLLKGISSGPKGTERHCLLGQRFITGVINTVDRQTLAQQRLGGDVGPFIEMSEEGKVVRRVSDV